MIIDVTQGQVETLKSYLGDRLQDEWKNMSQNMANGYHEDAQDDYDCIKDLVSVLLKLEKISTAYSKWLMPWEDGDDPLALKMLNEIYEAEPGADL